MSAARYDRAGSMSGLGVIITGMAKPIVGGLAAGSSRPAPMRYGWLPDIRIDMTGTFIPKAAGVRARLFLRTLI
jgi:hypothetical protein